MKRNIIKASVVTVEKQSLQSKIAYGIEGIQEPSYDSNKLAELFSYNGYHSKCINLKSVLTAGLGYELINLNDEINKDEENKLLSFINNHSLTSGQTLSETLIAFQTDYEIFGNAFLEVVRNNKKEVSEIYHLPAKDIRLIYRENKIYAVQIGAMNNIEFNSFGDIESGKNEFVMLKNYNPADRFYGAPEYAGCLSSIMLDRCAVEYNINHFSNNSIPESIIVVKGAQLNDEAKTKIKEFFTNNFRGTSNAGRSLILETDDDNTSIDIKPAAQLQKDSSFQNLRIETRDEIIASHGVPKRMLGIAEAGSLGGINESRNQLKIFQECVVEVRQQRLEFLLNEIILRKGLNIKSFNIKLNKMYVENPDQDARFYEVLLRNNVVTTEEVRNELGYN